ncbi:MAG: PmoA family protein [Planctomycetota bacterium]|nr:PmoA family protein [Planctomycetota bacterium]
MTQRLCRFLFSVLVLTILVVQLVPVVSAQTPVGAAHGTLTVRQLGDPGPLEIMDGDRPVLRYNYQVVQEPSEVKDRISEGNRKYAVGRSDYIHPLYGLNGEVLTDDWLLDHPHHRGIYWAWPEVDWQGQRGDLHALQLVLARPTGKVRIEQGADFAQIEAENEWRWQNRTPIVREQTILRAHRQVGHGRAIDLHFRFTALDADVQVARRGQTLYGGLNVRLSAAQDQQIATFTDPPTALPRRTWAHRSGIPRGSSAIVGLTILQSPLNPDYPGDWVQYPNLSWVQPTFPASGTRYTITKDRPLDLWYRLWIHAGQLKPETLQDLWQAYQTERL